MTDLRADFFRQNEWAGLRILEACRPLTDEQLDATVAGTYGSIRATLRHILSAEAWYATILGHPPAVRLRHDEPWPGFDRLAEVVSANAEALVAAAADPPDRIIRVGSEEEPEDAEAAVVLVQAFHHATDHRSQICTIISTLGAEAPEWSSWDWGLASGRMRKV
ncbi:MAG: damage-inducible protein DinB [Actinobacteria bacterium]|nr:damage-inducible protein DinB [Actinomycetota bacterium]